MTTKSGCYRFCRRRWRHPLVLAGVALVLMAFLSCFYSSNHHQQEEDQDEMPSFVVRRHLLAHHEPTNQTNVTRSPQFPPDLFTPEQLRRGAVTLHVFGMIYMFVALAIVCDEFFIPALYVITDKLAISEDVAGATFMAAGGSAPELFTSVIGVFISFDDVGIGTIVGSAVFNILFVISMCAIFSKTVLHLTWWPLFRDVSFYSMSLIILMLCFRDNTIFWYEASILLLCYAAYVTFMKFNEQVERRVKKLLTRNKVTRVGSTDQLMPHLTRRRMSTPLLHGAGTKFRHGLLQLMIHTIDPLHEGSKLDEKASQLHAIASLRVLLDATKSNGTATLQNGAPRCSACANCPACNHQCSCNVQTTSLDGNPDVHIQPPSPDTRNSLSVDREISRADSIPNIQDSREDESEVYGVAGPLLIYDLGTQNAYYMERRTISAWTDNRVPPLPRSNTADARMEMSRKETQENLSKANHLSTVTIAEPGNPTQPEIEAPVSEEDGDEPLDLSWPPTLRKRLNYVALAPIIFPLWLTLPDVRRPEKKRWFPISFLGSILWIAIFSYLMVWWASEVGNTVGLPSEVMGLTFLAAGTSIPDLITSVLVARKGFGDMAVSSSVGSNIFDVTVGLPFPWLLACMVFGPVTVNSTGMVCSIFVLFLMLLFVIVSIAVFKWKLNVGLAIVMFFLYFVFIAVSLMLEYEVINCGRIIATLTGK